MMVCLFVLFQLNKQDWEHFIKTGNTHNRVFLSKFGKETVLDYRFKPALHKSATPEEVTLVFGSESKGLFDLIGQEAMDGPVLSLPSLVLELSQ